MNAVFTKHNDPSHGWLEVEESELAQIGAKAADFSGYSYRYGSRLFLEEDCDASKFFTLWKAKFGEYPRYVVEYYNYDFPEDRGLDGIHS
jgi:hypothetical protein